MSDGKKELAGLILDHYNAAMSAVSSGGSVEDGPSKDAKALLEKCCGAIVTANTAKVGPVRDFECPVHTCCRWGLHGEMNLRLESGKRIEF